MGVLLRKPSHAGKEKDMVYDVNAFRKRNPFLLIVTQIPRRRNGLGKGRPFS